LARNIAAVAVAAALLAPATAGAQAVAGGGAAQAQRDARYDLRVFPRVGTPTTTFRATIFEFSLGRVRRGDRVTLTLTPDDLFIRSRPRWCPGSYVGYVYYAGPGFRTPLIGYFSFGVGRAPVSLAP
jgi:hypothetical protein